MSFSTLLSELTIVLIPQLCYYNNEKIPVFESEVRQMKGPVLNISVEDIMGVVQKLLDAFKKIMEWLGILVLPTEEQKPDYPNQTQPDLSEIAQGAGT